jgi:ubiquinone/menaquinone biosynthesis C-methylase UbiE
VELDRDIEAHYGEVDEAARLAASAIGRLEFVRTSEILARHLPSPPARVLDVGGGPGRYAMALARDGYDVRVIDPVARHVEQAREAAQTSGLPFEVRRGDARRLDVDDDSIDAVLLLGPLYHLDVDGRRQALREATRVLRRGGVLVAAAISRFASLLDGARRGWLGDEQFAAIVERDLATGGHRNPDPVGHPQWFTTAWFHRPEELRAELEAAGFDVEGVLAVEGPLWLLGDLDERWADEVERDRLLAAVRAVESEPSLLGVSAHLLATSRLHGDRDPIGRASP